MSSYVWKGFFSLKISHRDLKLANLFCSTGSDRSIYDSFIVKQNYCVNIYNMSFLVEVANNSKS